MIQLQQDRLDYNNDSSCEQNDNLWDIIDQQISNLINQIDRAQLRYDTQMKTFQMPQIDQQLVEKYHEQRMIQLKDFEDISIKLKKLNQNIKSLKQNCENEQKSQISSIKQKYENRIKNEGKFYEDSLQDYAQQISDLKEKNNIQQRSIDELMEIEKDLRTDFRIYKEDHMSMKEVKEMQLQSELYKSKLKSVVDTQNQQIEQLKDLIIQKDENINFLQENEDENNRQYDDLQMSYMKKMEIEKELLIKIEKLQKYKSKHNELRKKLESIQQHFDESQSIYECDKQNKKIEYDELLEKFRQLKIQNRKMNQSSYQVLDENKQISSQLYNQQQLNKKLINCVMNLKFISKDPEINLEIDRIIQIFYKQQ